MPPVGVFFETDNLNTLTEESELMLSFLATFAQEESVKKSESMNWSLQQRFKTGKLLTPELLGYSRPRDASGRYIKYGRLEIVESEAVIVRFIFDAFLAGKSPREIAALLTDIECPTKTGIRPCSPDTPDCLRWATGGGDSEIKNRDMMCKIFAAKVFDLMEWNGEYRYKILGKPCDGEFLFLFKLSDFELFVSGKRKGSYLPTEWRDYFGVPVEKHEAEYKINLADGYITTDKV